ncbi:MAG: hypothetical protein QXF82_10125, partial [Nitrososphaeria archaeon]
MVEGFVGSLFGVFIGFGFSFAFRNYIYGWIESRMYESLSNYILDSLEDLQKDPEKFLPYIKPLLQMIMKELLKEAQGNASKPLNIFGIKIPPELA